MNDDSKNTRRSIEILTTMIAIAAPGAALAQGGTLMSAQGVTAGLVDGDVGSPAVAGPNFTPQYCPSGDMTFAGSRCIHQTSGHRFTNFIVYRFETTGFDPPLASICRLYVTISKLCAKPPTQEPSPLRTLVFYRRMGSPLYSLDWTYLGAQLTGTTSDPNGCSDFLDEAGPLVGFREFEILVARDADYDPSKTLEWGELFVSGLSGGWDEQCGPPPRPVRDAGMQ